MLSLHTSAGFLALLISTPSILVSASTPFSRAVASFPRDVAHIALDEENGLFHGYRRDGTFYSSYNATGAVQENTRSLEIRAGTCAALSPDDAKTIPAWAKIVDYAKANFGKGSYKLATNPDGYLNQPATACVGDENVNVNLKGKPTCVTQTASTDGKLVGTSGTVSIGFWEGYTSTATHTVTKSSTFGISEKVSATFKIPEVADVGVETTTSADFTNSVSDSFATTINSQTTQTLTITSPDGKTCHAEYQAKNCNASGSGKVRYVAGGWVWFNYDSKTKGHYKWAASLDSILPNQNDRSSYLEFTSSMTGSSHSDYHGKCA